MVSTSPNIDQHLRIHLPPPPPSFQPPDHSSFPLNVTSSDEIAATLSLIRERYQRPPSIVINSAGITRDQFLLKMTDTDFDAVIAVNLKGTFLMMRAFAQAMIEADVRPGSIVNLASIVGKMGNLAQANYAASKGGVESMTRVASKEFGRYGIRVNAVLPGFVKTQMTDVIPEKVKAMAIAASSLKRFGQPEEIAEVIAFLASERSSFVNGASIEATGGC